MSQSCVPYLGRTIEKLPKTESIWIIGVLFSAVASHLLSCQFCPSLFSPLFLTIWASDVPLTSRASVNTVHVHIRPQQASFIYTVTWKVPSGISRGSASGLLRLLVLAYTRCFPTDSIFQVSLFMNCDFFHISSFWLFLIFLSLLSSYVCFWASDILSWELTMAKINWYAISKY